MEPRHYWLPLSIISLLGCAAAARPEPTLSSATQKSSPIELDAAALRYVKLVLALGQLDERYVDSYYGPEEFVEEAKTAMRPLAVIYEDASNLASQLTAAPVPGDSLVALRRSYLLRQTTALLARVKMLRGEVMPFDVESKQLYDAVAPAHSDEHFIALQNELEQLVPGDGPLPERIDRYRQRFIVPRDKLSGVVQAALDESRRRTKQYITLPDSEGVTLEFVTNQNWGGYNRYQGQSRSLIQINTDLPVFIGRVLDLAAHEGYPGHHVYGVLLEQNLVRGRGWIEFSIAALYSPQALISEGSANYGVELAFPDLAPFLRDILFAMAGLPGDEAERYARVEQLMRTLGDAETEAARRYIDGRISREQCRDYLIRYRLLSPPRAEKLLPSIDETRSYIINYNIGQDLVRDFVTRSGTSHDPATHWARFAELLSSPRLASDLR
jgi:hypothetical protein